MFEYQPTAQQLADVAVLEVASVDHRWRIDAAAIDGGTDELCANDIDHGWATVYGLGSEVLGLQALPDGFCPACAVRLIELVHQDPHWSGDVISLDVLRSLAVSA